MVQRERIADNVFSFQSDVYAQVNSGAVIGPNFAVVIDTLATPEETLEIREFIEQDLNVPVRYVIDTHYHADHTWGNCYFTGATIIAHSQCRAWMDEKGKPSLEKVKQQDSTYRNVHIVLPNLVFTDGNICLKVGKKNLNIFPLPGHSADNIAVLVEEDRALFSGDVFMPLPYIVDGDYDDMVLSLKKISKMSLENVVQGHGDIILRGEIDNSIRDNLAYLSAIRKAVRKAGRRKYPQDVLDEVDIESCGKSRILIGGLAEELHARNLKSLFKQIYGETPSTSSDDDYEYEE